MKDEMFVIVNRNARKVEQEQRKAFLIERIYDFEIYVGLGMFVMYALSKIPVIIHSLLVIIG